MHFDLCVFLFSENCCSLTQRASLMKLRPPPVYEGILVFSL